MSFLQKPDPGHLHPVVRYLRDLQLAPDAVKVEVYRPKDAIGYKAAKLYLHISGQAPKEYAWDDELNEKLIEERIPAATIENEEVRYALVLRHALRRVATKFGDGFYNSVLTRFAQDEFEGVTEVASVLRHVSTPEPLSLTGAKQDCREVIEAVLRESYEQLTTLLRYDESTAKRVLAGAVALYLDERFSVSDRARLGLG